MSEYDAAADAWVAGPQAVYARLATAALECAPVPVGGAKVLDVGAGTAVAAQAALAAGAQQAIATDVSMGMLQRRPGGIPAVLADAAAIPFDDDSFDLVVAAFCLAHLDAPAAALADWRRVAPAAVVSAFAPGPPHPAKDVVDRTMADFGYRPPDWYLRLKDDGSWVEEPGQLAELAASAGYAVVEVHLRSVDVGLEEASDVVAWRAGMAHLAPFLAGLDASRREEALAAAEAAVADLDLSGVVIGMQVLSACRAATGPGSDRPRRGVGSDNLIQ